MRSVKLQCILTLLIIFDKSHIVQLSKGTTNQDQRKFLFWELFDLLKNTNDIDIQEILVLSSQPQCHCEDSLCDLVKDQILLNDYMTASRCIYLNKLLHTSNASSVFNKILATTKPSLVVILGHEELLFRTLIPVLSPFQISNHIWLAFHTHQETSNVSEKITHIPKELIGLEQFRFDSKIFLWKENSEGGHLWEIYRFCSNGPIMTKHLMTMKQGSLIEHSLEYLWERRKDMSGCEIRVGYINSHPYMYENTVALRPNQYMDLKMCMFVDDKTMCGNYVPLLKLLKEELNFTIRWVHTKDNAFGVLDPITNKWNGLLGLLSDKESEISPCWHFITSNRIKDMDFSDPISEYGGHLYMKRPHISASWGTYFNVFDRTYWLIMIIFLVLISISCLIFFSVIDKMNFKSSVGQESCSDLSLYFTSGLSMVLLGLGCLDVSIGAPRNVTILNSLRILFLVICLFGAMNYYIYNSGLISLLTIERYDLPINKMEDFLSKPDYQLMLMSADGLESYFSVAEDLVRKTIWDEKLFGNSKAYVSSTIEGESLLMKNSKNVLFLSPDSATGFSNYPCGITRATKEFAKHSVGYGFQKNSPYVGLFSYIINDLIEFGNVEYIQSSIAMEKHSVMCDQNKDYKQIGYENIFSVFLLFFVGILISCIKLVFEIINRKYFI